MGNIWAMSTAHIASKILPAILKPLYPSGVQAGRAGEIRTRDLLNPIKEMDVLGSIRQVWHTPAQGGILRWNASAEKGFGAQKMRHM